MQTNLHDAYIDTAAGREAEAILRSCVHCGFCTATCPTYLELGDERDGPRGRIYLMKQMFETAQASERTVAHLDRCLSCCSCETTCPSKVRYGRLLDLGRSLAEQKVQRSGGQRLVRWALRRILPYENRFTLLLRLGQLLRRMLPAALQSAIPLRKYPGTKPRQQRARKMLLLAGCVQPGATPLTNAAAMRVMDRLGITLVEMQGAGCCGAISHHLVAHDEALAFTRRNIDAWWPAIAAGAEAIVISASGCGAMVREYGYLLQHDLRYAAKARRISELARDLSEVLLGEDISRLRPANDKLKTAVHCPCTLQHRLGQPDNIEKILQHVGIRLAKTRDKFSCCGSAGTYSLLQPQLSRKLRDKKLAALSIDNPERIVTANVGCQLHLAGRAIVPVQHWIELLDNQEEQYV